MNRTMIWKAEEKELGERLYRKLQGLVLLSPPTEDFRKCLSEDMFLKPNSQAFIHTMHFLFRLLDPAEFKKRFYWPVTDKRGEAHFRSSTMEYLKHLNEKHQLHWANIKSYLVVMPGGMKFITFMLDLVKFVIQEQVKVREKQLCVGAEFSEEPRISLKCLLQQNEFYKMYASQYISEISTRNQLLREKIMQLKERLDGVSQETGVSATELINAQFQAEFEQDNQNLYERLWLDRIERITNMEKLLATLTDVVTKFLAKEAALKINKDALRASYDKIVEFCDNDAHALKLSEKEDTPRINTLITAFNCIYEPLRSLLKEANEQPRCSEDTVVEMKELSTELQDLEKQARTYQINLNANIKKRKQLSFHTPKREDNLASGSNCIRGGNSLMHKYVCTPPIEVEAEHIDRSRSMRLPLLEEIDKASNSFNNPPTYTRSTRKPRNMEQSIHLNNSQLNNTKIIDSMQLLRTINRQPTRQTIQQDTTLSAKWKEMQSLFEKRQNDLLTPSTPQKIPSTELENYTGINEQLETTISTETPLEESPNATTPFNSNDYTRVPCSKGRIGNGNSAGNNSHLYVKRLSAVKKVQDDSLNFLHINTSPSGRLDALVSTEVKAIPKILLNDISLHQSISEETHEESANRTVSVEFPEGTTSEVADVQDAENNPNVANALPKIFFDLCALDDKDTLFNVSDSVLNNVSM